MRVIGNFKMNLLTEDLVPYEQSKESLWVAPQICHLSYFQNKNLNLGAQNCHYELEGAFTGEVSAKALKDLGVKFVILHHKERQQDLFMDKRIQRAQEMNLEVIYCLGEENQGDQIQEFPLNQKITYAYEPYWSIGTGLVPDQNYLQEKLHSLKEQTKASIFYGGSVSRKNIEQLSQLSWDGFLVGKASLNYEEFLFLHRTCLQV